jgi:hypothetical protein
MKRSLLFTFLTAAFLVVLSTEARSVVIVTTDFGAGADAHVNDEDATGDRSNDNFGTLASVAIKNDVGANFTGFNRLGFFRFDLSGTPESAFTQASLSLTLSGVIASATSNTYELRAVTDDTWVETTITFNNAPAASLLLGTFTIPTTAASVGMTFSFSSPELLSFVNAASDDLVSLRLWRTTENDGNENFAAREHLTLAPPTLTLTPIPEPASWLMMLLGFGVMGALSCRRFRLPHPGAGRSMPRDSFTRG